MNQISRLILILSLLCLCGCRVFISRKFKRAKIDVGEISRQLIYPTHEHYIEYKIIDTDFKDDLENNTQYIIGIHITIEER